MNGMGQDEGLAFHLAQFQARGYPHTQDEHDGRAVLLELSTQSLDGELLLGNFPNEHEQQHYDEFKANLEEVEWEQQQQDQSLNKIVDADIGRRLNQPNPSFLDSQPQFPLIN